MSSTRPPDLAAGSWRRELALTAAAAGAVVLYCLTLLLWDPGFFWIDDFQSGAMPAYCEMARTWRSGEIPLLNRCSWRAGAPGCEFPAGVFSPTLAGCILLVFELALPMPLAAATISILHLAVLAAGAFRVARQRGLSADLAILVALTTSVNGWIILWGACNWGVCLFSFAWLPWAWWGLEFGRRPAHGWIRFVPAGLFLFLLITAGWPLTVLMAGLVTAWLAARTLVEERRVLRLWPAVAAWLVGLGLSAPAWLMLLAYMSQTVRGQTDPLQWSNTWMVPWSSLPGLIFPGLISDWNVFGSWRLHQDAELAGGLVPIVILAVCLKGRLRSMAWELRWELGLLAVTLLLATSPSLGNFRWSFRWLPLFFLALGLTAAHALALWRDRTTVDAETTPRLGTWALVFVLVVWLRAIVVHVDTTPMTFLGGVVLLAVCMLWSEMEKRLASASAWRAWLPCGVLLVSTWMPCACHAPYCEVPRWGLDERIARAEPLDVERRYLCVYTDEEIFDWRAYRATHRVSAIGGGRYIGNVPMYAGLHFINGYSPFGPRGLDKIFEFETHGYLKLGGAERLLIAETGGDGLLALLGVDGLIVADRFAAHRPRLIAAGWHEAARVEDATVYHRDAGARIHAVTEVETVPNRAEALMRLRRSGAQGPVPLLLIDERQAEPTIRRFASALVTLVEDGRHRAVAEVQSSPGDGDILVVFTRPWFPGYEATCDGQPVPVELLDLILPAVRVPAGTNGRVVLQYCPRAVTFGGLSAGVTACAVATALLAFLCHRAVQANRTGPVFTCRTAISARR